ncbi:MAG TPA: ADOP family duplicated permease [Bryobacteraceae bacterium]|nr:ADOP family duplicated permease [Bryobacteraceae bacterium]
MRRLWLKLLRRRSMEQDIEAELAFHREMAALHGNPIPMGNTTFVKEQARELWRFQWMENWWRDLLYSLRSLRRSPALVITALLSLGLGIGVNTGIFSLAVEFLLSQPSVHDPGSVVSVILGGNSHARADVVEFVRASGLFQDVVGANEETFINFDNGADTRQVFCVQTTTNYFAALGTPMAQGRGFGPTDSAAVAVVSDHFWRTELHADSAIVGRAIRLDGRAYTVVGILPADHRTLIGFGFSPDVFVPRYLDNTYLAIYARLMPGMTLGQARAGALTLARRLNQALPDSFPYEVNCSVTRVGGFDRLAQENQVQTMGLFFAMLMVVVGLVLLVACLNVASLLLARGSSRRQELATRVSLGAGRGRLFQQLLIESLLLAMAGAALGLMLHQAMGFGLARLRLPLPFPIRLHLHLDWRVMTYAMALTGFATLASGMLPAWRSVKRTIMPDMRRESRLRGQRVLVAVQVALSVAVLAAGMLFLRNLWRAQSISPGFDVRHTLRAAVNLPPVAYKDTQRKRAYVAGGLRALAAIPGVEASAAAQIVPFTDSTINGYPITLIDTGKRVQTRIHWNAVSPDYFRVMSIPILRGRTFPSPGDSAVHQVIVNRTFAERYLSGRDPLGRAFSWFDTSKPYVVVGIAGDTKNMTIGEDDEAQLYEDFSQIKNDRTRIQFVVRSAIPPIEQLRAVHNALRHIDPNAGLEVATLYSSIGLAFLPSQVGAVLLGGVGVLGLLLAAIGLYGVMVYSVNRRTREIGVRLALGADRRGIARMVLASAARLVLAGSIMGLACTVFLVKPLAIFLVPGLHPGDPVSFAAVILLLASTGLAAAWSPARRAARIDPMQSLRYE